MSSQKDEHYFSENTLLSRLPRPDYDRLRASLKPMQLPKDRTLFEAGDSVRHLYFLTGGMVSLLAATEEGATVQVAMAGSEGLLGVPALLGINAMPYRVVVQLPGMALRASVTALAPEFSRGGPLHDAALRYLHTLITQITQSALCNRYHTIEERLCRWLLISRDCVRSDVLALTQESLAHMIGAQRTGVTAAAAALRRAGLVSYTHGRIRLLDIQGLEKDCCECYRVISRELEQYVAA
jgi:CRP-like cAMP-binding protein